MKVLIISTVGLIYDGITSVIISYLEKMDKSGFDFFVAGTINVEPNIKKKLESLNCNIIIFPNRKTQTIKYAAALTQFIKKNKIEVIHAHGNSSTLAIELTAAWLGGCKKRIAHSHNTKCTQVKADRFLRPLFNIMYTEALACGTEAGKWLFKKQPFSILANGRDLDEFSYKTFMRNNIRKKYSIDKELTIGHVGSFVKQKNHVFLVEIYREIKRLEPKSKFFMIGDGPLRNEIEKKSSDIGVIFTGNIDNVADYLHAMDAMLLPSLFEGLPLVVIEWQINGLPCLLSNKITKECDISRLVYYMSLDNTPLEWAEKIIAIAKSNNRPIASLNTISRIKNTDFNIQESAKKLRRLYLK